MPRVHQMRTDLAQFYNSTKPSARLSYITGADDKVNFQINGTDLLLRDLNIFCTTTANHRAILEQLKQMAMQNNTTGASIYDLGKIVQSDSVAELNTAMKASEAKQQEQKQQEMQQQQQMQQEQLASAQKQKEMEIQANAERDDKMIQKEITVAEIRSAGFGAMKDINENKVSDYEDSMKEIRQSEQYQQQTDLQREKQTNENMRSTQKMDIERQKLQVQQDIADKQLQIARENKNKFDDKKNEKGKK
tara:strand:- start:259 stop:1002 length:744 start_codon:yes stop_codon:yes gene_type:complete